MGVKWVDANKGDKESPEYRCRLVAKEIKKDKREDLLAAMPPLGSEEDAVLALGKHARDVFGFWRRGSCLPSREGKEKSVCGVVGGGFGGGKAWIVQEGNVWGP